MFPAKAMSLGISRFTYYYIYAFVQNKCPPPPPPPPPARAPPTAPRLSSTARRVGVGVSAGWKSVVPHAFVSFLEIQG